MKMFATRRMIYLLNSLLVVSAAVPQGLGEQVCGGDQFLSKLGAAVGAFTDDLLELVGHLHAFLSQVLNASHLAWQIFKLHWGLHFNVRKLTFDRKVAEHMTSKHLNFRLNIWDGELTINFLMINLGVAVKFGFHLDQFTWLGAVTYGKFLAILHKLSKSS